MERNERELRKRHTKQQQLRMRQRRRRRAIFLLWQIILIAAIVFLGWRLSIYINKTEEILADEAQILLQDEPEEEKSESEKEQEPAEDTEGLQAGDYVEQVGLEEVEKPVKRNERETLSRLIELSEEYTDIQGIVENEDAYPDNMLEALANNPEMTGFVLGYLTAETGETGGLTAREKKEEHPLFLQWDPRWGYVPYGDDSNVGLAGCGPTCLSMALYALTRDETLTPDAIAVYAMENEYYMPGTGTLWALMEDVPVLYGINVENPKLEEEALKEALDAEKILICAMRQGDFTAVGHFIVIYGYDENGFLVNDPNCVARSRKSWSFAQIGGQIKQAWALGE